MLFSGFNQNLRKYKLKQIIIIMSPLGTHMLPLWIIKKGDGKRKEYLRI